MIRIVIPGVPRGKARARVTRSGHAYTPDETVNSEAFIKKLAWDAMDGRPLLLGPLGISVVCYFAPPKSASKKAGANMLAGRELPTKKPDIDNVVKLVCDALNGVVYRDDAQITSLMATKHYGPGACMIVMVRQVGITN